MILRRGVQMMTHGGKPLPLHTAAFNMTLESVEFISNLIDYSAAFNGNQSILAENKDVEIIAADKVFDERLVPIQSRPQPVIC